MPLLAKIAICFEVIHEFFADERQNSPENWSNALTHKCTVQEVAIMQASPNRVWLASNPNMEKPPLKKKKLTIVLSGGHLAQYHTTAPAGNILSPLRGWQILKKKLLMAT